MFPQLLRMCIRTDESKRTKSITFLYTVSMLKKIHRHIQTHLSRKNDKNVLLLRLLLLTMLFAITYMILQPAQKNMQSKGETILLNTQEIEIDDTFRMATTHLCAAVLEAKVTKIQEDALDISFIKKQDGSRAFVPLKPTETHTIRNGTCIPAHTACEGLRFEYCFSLNFAQKSLRVDYEVVQR